MGESYMEMTFENLETVRVPDEYVFWFEFVHDLDSEGSTQFWLQLSPEAGNLPMGFEPLAGKIQTLRERLREFNDITNITTYVNGDKNIELDVVWTDDSDEMIENNGGFLEEKESGDIHVGAGEYYRRVVE